MISFYTVIKQIYLNEVSFVFTYDYLTKYR